MPLPTSRQWRAIARRLAAEHGAQVNRGRRDPLSSLIRTLLSQSTTDVLSARAFDSLRRAFPSWEQVRRARVTSVAAALRHGGLAQSKARWIKALLHDLHAERGELSLDFLSALPPSEALEYLTHFDGVGPKTAACVCLFALGHPVFPVDTHIHRLAKRLGWVAERDSAERTFRLLDASLPADLKHQLHVNLIAHGRTVCQARQTHCQRCVLRRYCQTYTAASSTT